MPSEAHEQLVQAFLDNPTRPDATLDDRRVGFDAYLAAQPVPEKAEVTVAELGGVPVEWVTVPGAREDRVVFYLHGGGYAMGSAVGYRGFTARVAHELRTRVVSVDYRLAPEAPYPAPFDDAFAAYRALLDDGFPAGRVIIAGDSGSVGFSLALAARVRDEGIATPAAVVGFCPWVDLAVGDTISEAADVGDPFGTRESLTFFADEYLQGHPPTDPVVNMLYSDLRELPPLLLLAATRDVGYRDALSIAERARRAVSTRP